MIKKSLNGGGNTMASEYKKQQLDITKQSESDVDLGYTGQFTGMNCQDLPTVEDKLECNYEKYEFDDPLAKSDIKHKAMEKKRKTRHEFRLQSICMYEDPFLCATKDIDDEDKEKNDKCMKIRRMLAVTSISKRSRKGTATLKITSSFRCRKFIKVITWRSQSITIQ